MFQTCLDCGSLSAHTHQYPTLCSNTFGLRFCVCVQASGYSPLTKHVRIVVPCCLQASAPPYVSSTFGMWILVRVQASVSSTVFQTRMDCGSLLCTSISLHPCPKHVLIMVPGLRTHQSSALCFECVWIVDPCLCTRIRLQPFSSTFEYVCLFVCPHPRTKMKVTPVNLLGERTTVWMMWHWYAQKKSSWTRHSLLRQKLRVFRAIPWLRKCASKKWALCREAFATGRHGQSAS